MSQKYVIGLTGNIATGKSIVRRMLQELGASTVDADSLVHMLQRPGTPVYKGIVKTFGTFVVNGDGSINRKRLGDIAFSSPEALKALEEITHPAVRAHIERSISRAPTYVVVIEAIKLLEGGLADSCDAVWVVDATEDTQMVRLMTKRKMSSQDAMMRIRAQPPQADKLAKADVVIKNEGDLIETWNIVQKSFLAIPVPEAPAPDPAPVVEPQPDAPSSDKAAIEIRRAKRDDLAGMAALMASATGGSVALEELDMMERLFSKGYLVATQNEDLLGMIGWQTENLIAGVDDFFLKSASLWPTLGEDLIERVESAVSELSCEAGFIFLHEKTGPLAKKCLQEKGYSPTATEDLKDRMWREAANDWAVEDTTMMFKQLLERRINTPI